MSKGSHSADPVGASLWQIWALLCARDVPALPLGRDTGCRDSQEPCPGFCRHWQTGEGRTAQVPGTPLAPGGHLGILGEHTSPGDAGELLAPSVHPRAWRALCYRSSLRPMQPEAHGGPSLRTHPDHQERTWLQAVEHRKWEA